VSTACVRVVIAGDYLPLRRLLREVLVDRGCTIVGEVCDGEEAIALVLAAAPDVVVMDAHMPGVDGLEATRVIRDRDPEVEVVLFTATTTPSLVREAFEAGASYVFPKTTLGLLVDRVAAQRRHR
jgi:DNA-binding NarL/FixJ family response regulator